MASVGGTFKLWRCSECHETEILMMLGDCPQCGHSRCMDCDVKSYADKDGVEKAKGKKRIEGSADLRKPARIEEKEGEGSNVDDQRRSERGRSALAGRALSDFPIVAGIEHLPVFVLRHEADSQLIAAWNRNLSRLSDDCLREFNHLEMTSVHLFRVGMDERSSRPLIIVNTALTLVSYEQHQIQKVISNSAFALAAADFQIPISFRLSRLRRSLDSLTLPPICQPRNREFCPIPGTGASIGIAESFGDTATLGCYLLIDKDPAILTVNHLISTISTNTTITHIAQQDHFERLLQVLDREMRDLAATGHTCYLCRPYGTWPSEGIENFMKQTLRRMLNDGHDPARLGQWWACPFHKILETKCASPEFGTVHRIAEIYAHSGRVFQLPDGQREMDWALFRTMPNTRSGLSEHILDQHRTAPSWGLGDLHVGVVRPGALIRSLGRTSGHQKGQISETTSMIFHVGYITQEWCVIKRSEALLYEWIEGGVGVEGDSGALIVDEKTQTVYGMLWGRIGDGPATATIFTPMTDLLDDIKARKMATEVEFVSGQRMPWPRETESQQTPGSTIIESTSLEEQSVGIFYEEESTEAFNLTGQFSTDTRHPHSFERYRGGDGPSRSVPRSTAQPTVEDSGSGQWPGVHTYLRYAVAPEQE